MPNQLRFVKQQDETEQDRQLPEVALWSDLGYGRMQTPEEWMSEYERSRLVF
jgi:hypothetical protein